MNTVILTLVIFFNGTTHIETVPYSPENWVNPMHACIHKAHDQVTVLAKTLMNPAGIKILSIQCTVQQLKE